MMPKATVDGGTDRLYRSGRGGRARDSPRLAGGGAPCADARARRRAARMRTRTMIAMLRMCAAA